MDSRPSDRERRLREVRRRIRAACERHDRRGDDVRLIAVSKTHPVKEIAALHALGQRAFGESYAREALDKARALRDLDIEWHFIGRLQSNKCRDVARLFDWVHGVDRVKVARRLNEAADPRRGLNVFIQVNLEGERSKAGVAPEAVSALADELLGLERLTLRGLMAIPRPEADFDRQRRRFAHLRRLMEQQVSRGVEMRGLSMGMSDDLEAAVAEGATHVRVGTALFGPRDNPRRAPEHRACGP